MNIQIINLVNLSGIFLFLFATAELLYHRFQWKAEYTRKLVHVVAGLITMSFPLLFESILPVIVLCGSFFLMLGISKELKFLPSINNIDRISKGSFFFPIAILVSFWVSLSLSNPSLYYLPLLIMILADPFACLIGKRFPFGKFKVGDSHKTLMGSLGFLVVSFIISFSLLFLADSTNVFAIIFQASIIALGTCAAEAFSAKGYDNISIPIVASIILLLFS